MPRLFVAIDLPPEVKAIVAGLSRELSGARWVGGEELHLTLRFLGEVDADLFASIKTALAGVAGASFPLGLRGVGHFPPGRHPRVLWVGMETTPPLLRLQRDIELALIGVGVEPDERPFSPHITVARLKDPQPEQVERFETRHAGLVLPPFQVRTFILYSSVLTRQGAIHNQEKIYPCRDALPSPTPLSGPES